MPSWRKKSEPRCSVLDGSTDSTAPSWEQASAAELLQTINAGVGATEAGPVSAARGELLVRQIRAYEDAAAESADASRKLVRFTLAILMLTVVLVALTLVLAVGNIGSDADSSPAALTVRCAIPIANDCTKYIDGFVKASCTDGNSAVRVTTVGLRNDGSEAYSYTETRSC